VRGIKPEPVMRPRLYKIAHSSGFNSCPLPNSPQPTQKPLQASPAPPIGAPVPEKPQL
jgi:hypothetical protein